MYPITEAVMALFEAEHRKVLRITGTDKNGAAITITDDNVMEDSFQIDRYSCNGEKLEVGTAIAAQMTFSLENGDGAYDGIVFEDTELFAEVGIADWTQENPTVHWVPCGYFTPDMQPRRLSTISVTALDRMAKFDVVVDATDLTFPTTIAGLVGQVCTVCGVTLAQSIATLTNADVAVATLPSANGGMITYRNLIQWCAGIMGTNAWFDWNGQLRFSWYDNATGYVSTMDNRYSSDLYENDLTVTGVEYTNDSGIVIVEGTDDYAIDLTGNAIAGPLIATVLPPLNTALNGFTYRPFTAAAINAPYLWPMDIVTFTDKGGSNHSSALTNVVFGLNGTTALESKGMTYAINKAAQPKGFTREQAQLVNQVVAKNVESHIDDYLTQQEIFNRLTDNGAAQGLVLYNGQLYINASYINAGALNARFINFNAPVDDFSVPDENDPDSLLEGQRVVNGWIVNTSGSGAITALECDYAKLLRGRTVTLTFAYNGGLDYCEAFWASFDGDEGSKVTQPVSPANPYTYTFTVPDEAEWFSIAFTCSGIRQIRASVSGSAIVYPDDIQFTYAGLEIGRFTVDRSGNVRAGGWNLFRGATRFIGKVDMDSPLLIGSGGTGARSADGARTNLDVPSRTGAGASGTWGISVSGSAGSVAWGNVSGKPENYPGGCTGTAAGNAALHLGSYSFTGTQPLSKYVTFDQNNPSGGPTTAWFNGFVSSHNNYLASYIINQHRSADWYVGYGEFNRTTAVAPAPTWYKLLHSGNCTAYNAANVTGTVAVGHGGTGATSAAGARSNLGIHHGTTIRTFSSGKATISFSDFGVSSRPSAVIVTPSSNRVGMIYNWDLSSSNIVIEAFYTQNTTDYNGALRFSWIAIP